MKALSVVQRGRAEVVDLREPEAQPGEVCIAISHVGLCGTDLHVFDGAFGRFPMIPGHDAVGTVTAVGRPDNAGLLGRLVTIDPSACCLRAARPTTLCPHCRRGATNLCERQSYMGISAPGACAEFVVVPAARAIPIPPGVDAMQATCLEPIAVALHLRERIVDTPGDVAVFGAGPIGLAIAKVLARDRRVSLVEPTPARRAFARAEGCERVFGLNELPLPLPPVLIDAAGHASVAEIIEKHILSGS